MAEGTQPYPLKIQFFQVQGFPETHAEYLRFLGEVQEEAICVHCGCIPREIYRLLCPKHGLCIECKNYCKGYYCGSCKVDTSPEHLEIVPPTVNYIARSYLVMCHKCDKKMTLRQMEEHFKLEHTNRERVEQQKIEIDEDHEFWCQMVTTNCPSCSADVPNKDFKRHVLDECKKRAVHCGACTRSMAFDELSEHEEKCPKRPVTCNKCGEQVQRMKLEEHSSWCFGHLISCTLCHSWYEYSQMQAHLEVCVKAATRSAACEDDVSNEGFQCNQTPESKVQPIFGTFYHTKARSEEMHVHGSTCPDVGRECPDCFEKILGIELVAHLKTKCKKRQIDCEACNHRMPIDELPVHIGICEHWQIACTFCKCMIKRKDKSKHYREACSEFKVRCKFCNVLCFNSQLMNHEMECEENRDKCPDCGLLALRKDMTKHLSEECAQREVQCELCANVHIYSQKAKHLTECPKAAKECPDCAVPVVNEDLDKHLKEECQKRVQACQACYSPMDFDELNEHDKVCKDKPVACEKCRYMVQRKEMVKHIKESCSMRALSYEVCKEEYTYSDKTACHQQYVKKTYLCTYCDVELKASDDRDEHYKTCDRFPVECPFKVYGCDKKVPREEMAEHENNPHNALLNQVIIDLQERLAKIEKPLDKFVEELRRRKSSK